MNRRVSRFVPFAFAAAVLLGSGPLVSAAPPEPQPVTLECATGMSIQVLGKAAPASAEGQALTLVRAYFGVGGGIGPHTHPGTLVVVVEEGQFGVTLQGESDMGMMVMRASGDAATPPAEEMLTVGQEAVLEPGDWFIETGMVHSARTVGDEPAVVTFTGLTTAGEPLTTCA